MGKQHIVLLHKNECLKVLLYELRKVYLFILDIQLLALHFEIESCQLHTVYVFTGNYK